MKRSAILSILLILGTILAVEAFGQRRAAAPTYRVGQKVEVEFPFEWTEGEVVEIDQHGWIRVRTVTGDVSPPMPRDSVRPISGGGNMGGGFGGRVQQSGSYKPGEKVEVIQKGDWVSAMVISQNRHGWTVVRFPKTNVETFVPPEEIRRVAAPELPPPTMRTWTDSTGTFKTQAKFVKREGNQVTIVQASGKQLSLPMTKLSKADQDYVTSYSRAAADAAIVNNKEPFDYSAATINLADPGTTIVTADGITDLDSLHGKPIPLQSESGMSGGRMGETKSVVIHYPTARAFVSVTDIHEPGQVTCLDLKDGSVLGTLTLPEEMCVDDLSPNGQRMLVRFRGIAGRNSEQLYLYDMSNGPPREVASWQPYQGQDNDLDMTLFLDDTHVVTAGGENSLMVWDTANRNAVYSVPFLNTTTPAASPGRKQIALASKDGIYVLNASDGAPLAKLPGEPLYYMRFGFRPDGRQLVAGTRDRLQVWDLEKGTRVRDLHFPSWVMMDHLTWVGPDHIFVNGTDLVDLERGVVLWRYNWPGKPPAGAAVGGLYWTLLSDNMARQRAFIAMKLPHPAAEQAANRLTPDSTLAVKPGSEVTVQVNVIASDEEKQAIHDGLARRLESNGIRVVDGSPVVLKAETRKGKTADVAYGDRGVRNTEGTMQVTERISTLMITEGENVLWRVENGGGSSSFVHREQGESLDAVSAKALMPVVHFFLNTPIPQYLARPGKNGTYGRSEISMRGIRTIGN
jgi:WD40 repeat protein